MILNREKALYFAGVNTLNLVEKYGTPLYVYNVDLIRARAREFIDAFKNVGVKAKVSYASKAFSCVAMIQLANEEKLSLDVVSGGELFTAIKAGFPMERVHFHGNNKSKEELKMALDAKVGCIVVDNFHELDLLEQLCIDIKRKIKILLRVAPGVEAHTHEYVLTGHYDSKFGFDLHNGQAKTALKRVLMNASFEVLGFHSHIGSQIFEVQGFVWEVEKLFEKMLLWQAEFNYFPPVINVGGGFGIRYTKEDRPKKLAVYVEAIAKRVLELSAQYGVKAPEIWIEPGRSLVGEAGITLYKVGATKEIPGIRQYISVDGGMTDNIRPALYGAKYTAVVLNKGAEEKKANCTIVGKCCESGDVLIKDIALPPLAAGDILAILATGAYGYSMASNYNRFPKPAIVFIENGVDKLVVKRESYEDLVRNDLLLN